MQLVESSHNISIIYCYTILPPVHSKWTIINFPILPFMAYIRKLIWIPNVWLFEYVFVSSDTQQEGERLKLFKEENYAMKSD